MTVWHRTQRVPSQVAQHIGCTIASCLTCMAVSTSGRIGPAITLDAFRAKQKDQNGGIDLYDAKFAAKRFGVEFTVHSDFGPGPEYTDAEREALRDLPAATPAEATAMLYAHKVFLVSLDYSKLPQTWWFDRAFALSAHPEHALAVTGIRRSAGFDVLEISDPLAFKSYWRKASELWPACAAIAGHGKVALAVTNAASSTREAGVRPLARWQRFIARDGHWVRAERRTTVTGWHADATEPFWTSVAGDRVQLVEIRSGGYAGSAIAVARQVSGVTKSVWGTWSRIKT
jgi:hypothetical protein